jgi:putative Ca2+/H+ antiporter (TMEM165/GDT1 family)
MESLWFALEPRLFAATFATIFVAELPDKTALAALLLASRRRPSGVFVGAAAAFAVQSAVAVAFGGALSRLPARWVRLGAGLLFLAFAVAMWRRRPEESETGASGGGDAFWPAAASSFAIIFIAEWGDLTQLATAALTAEAHRPLTIFLAATTALWSVTALVVLLGRRLGRAFDPRRLEMAAAVLFALIGAYFLIPWAP